MSTRSGRIRTSVIEVSSSRSRKGASPTRSPARTRKSSPPAVKTPPPVRPSARKSPSRKSPSRKPTSKFPARKSPSRATKGTAEPAPSAPKSPTKRLPIQTDVAVKLESFASKFELYKNTRSRRSEFTVKDITSSLPDTELSKDTVNGIESDDVFGLRNRKTLDGFAPSRSSRLREFIDSVPDIRRSVSKSLSSKSFSNSVSKSLNYSDEENSDGELKRKSRSVTRKLATPLRSSISSLTQIASKWEFGGRIGSALLIFLIPLTVFAIVFSCKKSCMLTTSVDLSGYDKQATWFSLPIVGFFVSQLFIQAVLALLPICGTKADRLDGTGTKYCFNSLFATIITILILFGLDFLQVINKDVLLMEYWKLAVLSYLFAVHLSIMLYLNSRKTDKNELNPYGSTGYTIYDFFMGKEIHPFINKLDIKIWLYRFSNITSLILLLLIFANGIQIKIDKNEPLTLDKHGEFLNKIQLRPTILVFSMMQIVYILNFIMKEYKITTTFYWQSEGLGYLQTVAHALYPYYFTTISKYVADTGVVLSTNILITASVLYSVGFLIMLISNNIKHEFRKNPHMSLANIDIIPTFHGNKILVSNLWGILRHPNYTGDVLIHIALALPGIVTGSYVASLPALLTILILLHRAWRDHERCKRKYGAAWQRYCNRVPSVIIPKVL